MVGEGKQRGKRTFPELGMFVLQPEWQQSKVLKYHISRRSRYETA
jgi:hypothetical protein